MQRVNTSAYPTDFCMLLDDLIESDSMDSVEFVNIHNGLISDHFSEIDEESKHWVDYDFAKADEFLAALLNGDKFPPLIADSPGCFLRDGYHRMNAYRRAGLVTAEFIYLDRQ